MHHALATPTARPRQAAMSRMYAAVGVETAVEQASAHRLVALLFQGLLDAIDRARGAIEAGDVAAKCAAVDRALRIVDEGLRGGLDLRAGGTLAADLADLYAYLMRRLTLANARSDRAALDECRSLVLPLRQAWAEIGQQAVQA